MSHTLHLDLTASEVLTARQFALSLAAASLHPTMLADAVETVRFATVLTEWLLTGGAAEAVAAPAKVKRAPHFKQATYEAAFDAGETPTAAAARLGTKSAIVRSAYTRIRRARSIPPVITGFATFGRTVIAADPAA